METLIIQVNLAPNNQGRPPQLGITVEAPHSQQRALQQLKKQQQQQQAAKDANRHLDYQNLDPLGEPSLGSNKNHPLPNGDHTRSSSDQVSKYEPRRGQPNSTVSKNGNMLSKHSNHRDQTHKGLEITQIQPGSVIDRTGQFKVGDIIVEVNGVNLQRPFAEAQKTLKQFVIGSQQTSHAPLILKVLRKADSSSSLPSTAGSQITIVERNNNNLAMQPISPLTASTSPKKVSASISTSPASPKSSSVKTSTSSRHLVGALNTRKIGTKHKISLRKGKDGFGIKIAERDNMYGVKKPIFITAITTTGSAYKDGRLCEGDMLLEINGQNLSGMSQPEVTRMLKEIACNTMVELVVSRQEDAQESVDHDNHQPLDRTPEQNHNSDDCDINKSLIDLDIPEHDDSVFTENNNHQFEKKIDDIIDISTIDGPGIYTYDIPLNDTKSAGLGLYLKYPRRSTDGKDLGIWIEKVITGGAAWKDNRLQPNDQILAINGISLVGLSNAEASEMLTAAVCRGIGPEATPNTIRLNIHRRDPTVVAKILLGADIWTGHPDVIPNGSERSKSITDRTDQSKESFQTGLDITMQIKPANSLTDTSASSGSSNQNSQIDSAFSPQTQASNSIKLLSNSCNDRSDHYSSDKTNDTSSAISQITDFTNVPINDNTTISDKTNNTNSCDNHNDNNTDAMRTLPKSLQTDEEFQYDQASAQSWDDDSIDTRTGEEHFQRDGFGRQSISEKRHAQLMAKNTDTYRRNKAQRDERERQRKQEELLARQTMQQEQDEARMNLNHQRLNELKPPTSYTTSEFKSIYGLSSDKHQNELSNNNSSTDHELMHGYHREVPVDVHLPVERGIDVDLMSRSHKDHQERQRAKSVNLKSSNMDCYSCNNNLVPHHHQRPMADRCSVCGSTGPCCCITAHIPVEQTAYNVNCAYDQMIKRSNSLESVQQHHTHREATIVPRAGTVRVARNRRVNESFRVAVDRSYDESTPTNNMSINQDHHSSNHQQYPSSANNPMYSRVASSIANSTASTANEERYLLNGNGTNTTNTHKKSSSLLTKFLKFGSMKKNKNKNKKAPVTAVAADSSTQANDPKANSTRDMTNGRADSEATRSQTSVSSHSRTHSSQSHPNLMAYNQQMNSGSNINSMKYSDSMSGQLYSHTLKAAMQNLTLNQQHQQHHHHQLQENGNQPGDLNHQHRSSMPMCQYQQQMDHVPLNTHPATFNQQHLHNPPMTQAKYAHNVLNRPASLMTGNNHHQHSHHHQQHHPHSHYSQLSQPSLSPMQQQMFARPQQQHLYSSHPAHQQQLLAPPLMDPMTMGHPMNYPSAAAARSQMVHNLQVGLASNGACVPASSASNVWQVSPATGPAAPTSAIHSHSGLWVASAPLVSDSMMQQQSAAANSIYGPLAGASRSLVSNNNRLATMTQPANPMSVPVGQAPTTQPLGHQTYLPASMMSGAQQQLHNSNGSTNGIIHNRAPVSHQNPYGTTSSHHLHNQQAQPQHIYYYDF